MTSSPPSVVTSSRFSGTRQMIRFQLQRNFNNFRDISHFEV